MPAVAQPEKFAELFESRESVCFELLDVHRRMRSVENRLFDGQFRAEWRILWEYRDAPADFAFAVIDAADADNALLVATVDALDELEQRRFALT